MLGRLLAILTFSRRTVSLTGPAKVIDGDTIVALWPRRATGSLPRMQKSEAATAGHRFISVGFDWHRHR
jgi:hypothetical protein